jgi:hypothetical protein
MGRHEAILMDGEAAEITQPINRLLIIQRSRIPVQARPVLIRRVEMSTQGGDDRLIQDRL